MTTTRPQRPARRSRSTARTGQRTRTAGTTARRTTRLTTAQQDRLPDSQFAFRKQRKEPLVDARHVRNAVARFTQVRGVTDADRDRAWRRIRQAARRHGVEIHERGWRQLLHR
jgi:hypothetical protein